MPQGFKHSPHVFNKVVKEELHALKHKVSSTVIQYVGNLIICSDSQEHCHEDSITCSLSESDSLLQELAKGGHRASQQKLQYCQSKVEYLAQVLQDGTKSISPSHLKGISAAPKPITVQQMMMFLGIENYILYNYSTTPLRNMIKATGTDKLWAPLIWTEEGEQAFNAIKCLLQQAPALALPNYDKPFHLLFPTDFNVPQQFSHKLQVLEEKSNQWPTTQLLCLQ